MLAADVVLLPDLVHDGRDDRDVQHGERYYDRGHVLEQDVRVRWREPVGVVMSRDEAREATDAGCSVEEPDEGEQDDHETFLFERLSRALMLLDDLPTMQLEGRDHQAAAVTADEAHLVRHLRLTESELDPQAGEEKDHQHQTAGTEQDRDVDHDGESPSDDACNDLVLQAKLGNTV